MTIHPKQTIVIAQISQQRRSELLAIGTRVDTLQAPHHHTRLSGRAATHRTHLHSHGAPDHPGGQEPNVPAECPASASRRHHFCTSTSQGIAPPPTNSTMAEVPAVGMRLALAGPCPRPEWRSATGHRSSTRRSVRLVAAPDQVAAHARSRITRPTAWDGMSRSDLPFRTAPRRRPRRLLPSGESPITAHPSSGPRCPSRSSGW